MKREHRDPVTGDALTGGEYVSWIIQGIIRRWTFLGVITAATLLCWITNNPAVLQWWNLNASYLAIVIESVVGLAMFGQTRRDAVVLREVRATASRVEKVEQRHSEILAAIQQQDGAIVAILAQMHSQEDLILRIVESNRQITSHLEAK